MKEKLNNFFLSIKKGFSKMDPRFKNSLLAVGIGILVGFIVMLIFNPANAFPALFAMLLGGFRGGIKGVGDVLLKATPIILTGVALAVTFKSGLFNIGAPGQMVIGAYVAIHVGVLWPLPPVIHWLVALILGTIAGAIWGAIPGLLKAFRNVNEVVSSIMLNYIAMYLVVYLVRSNVYNQLYAKSKNILPSAELPQMSLIFGNSDVNIGLFIAIGVALLIHYVFRHTVLGYELKATGFNPDASRYAGMNSKLNIVTSMVISGAIVGLAGAIQYLVIGTNLGVTSTLLGEGFDGISVALLGMLEPIGALISGIFLSHIRQGGYYMQVYGFPPQIIEIIISIVVYTTSISAGISLFYQRIKRQREEKKLKESEDKN
ncbi:ABC transporter permease [Acholeplasma hippikon]|uniref:D-allose transporter subunit n=1 Tax=Acholeplasma hippikon TaxID=264636 RepID=A0A449BI29_9MOLU|nr:ABC transporter permease [Acholeplasma hippikon]VEU82095.1 D-allose transporter subunit [Acholeplasma hippikon]